MSQAPEIQFLKTTGRILVADIPQRGNNPDVFFYQLHQTPDASFTLLRMMFYGGFEVFALSGATIR